MPASRAAAAVSAAGSVFNSPGMETAISFSTWAQWVQIAADIFGVQHATNQIGGAFGEGAQMMSNRLTRGGIMSAIQPNFGTWRDVDDWACIQFLHAGGPMGL